MEEIYYISGIEDDLQIRGLLSLLSEYGASVSSNTIGEQWILKTNKKLESKIKREIEERGIVFD